MFSTRFDWQAPPNALSTLLERKRASGQTIIDLTQSNPTRVGLAYDQAAILAALSKPAAMVYEPDAGGLASARRAVAGYYRAKGCAMSPDHIFLTASTSEAYSHLFKLLGDADDEVLIPSPGYPLLAYLARLEGLRAVAYPLRYDWTTGWGVDIELLEALINSKTRAVIVVSPNNPTGSYLKQGECAAMDAICRRHHLALIVDEVFADYPGPQAPDDHYETVAGQTGALTFVLNGFSKILGLPQIKLGWIAVSGQAAAVADACQCLEALLDFYLSVATPVQHGVDDLLGLRGAVQRQILGRVEANSRHLHKLTARTANCRMLKREGGWYAVVEIDDDISDEQRAVRLLDRHDTLIHPGFFYDFHREGFVVVSLLPRPETFRKGVANLVSAFGAF